MNPELNQPPNNYKDDDSFLTEITERFQAVVGTLNLSEKKHFMNELARLSSKLNFSEPLNQQERLSLLKFLENAEKDAKPK